ncbi:MAG: hypothetical protein Q4G04_01415 [bacterium]|nr:hypothetical protein [bacterium]
MSLDTRKLADDMVQFAKRYDYYEFIDSVDDEEQAYSEQLTELTNFKSVKETIKYLNIIKDDIEDNLRDILFDDYVIGDGYGDKKIVVELKDNYKSVNSILKRLDEHINYFFDFQEINKDNILEFFDEHHGFDYDYEYVERLQDFIDEEKMLDAFVEDYNLVQVDDKYYFVEDEVTKELDEREV